MISLLLFHCENEAYSESRRYYRLSLMPFGTLLYDSIVRGNYFACEWLLVSKKNNTT
jgi:hypothetical protein